MEVNNKFSKNVVYINIVASLIFGFLQIVFCKNFLPMLTVGAFQIFTAVVISIIVINNRIIRHDTLNSVVKEEKEKQSRLVNYIPSFAIILITSVLLFVNIVILIDIKAFLANSIRTPNSFVAPIAIYLLQILIYVILNKLYEAQHESDSNAATWSALTKICLVISYTVVVALIFELLNVSVIVLILSIIAISLSIIFSLLILISAVTKTVKKQFNDSIINIAYLNKILSGKNPISLLLDYMEKNTSISFRSLWSINYLKEKLPIFLMLTIFIIWAGTCFVQVNSQSQAVVYRLGAIQSEKIMEPGLHVKLPWPFDVAKTYEVSRIKLFNVGFEETGSKDYLWTKEHSGEEYKLLLGDGKELVSINMKVAYRISDLMDYTLNYGNPEDKLKGEAYQLIMKETVTTNMDNILCEDRYALSEKLQTTLNDISDIKELGLEITSVTIQSIHPPVEVAENYQAVISAKIQKEVLKNVALAKSKATIPEAMVERDTLINDAVIEQLERKADAISDTVLFKYQYMAFSEDEAFYKWRKWIESYEKAIKNKKIFIIEEDSNLDEGKLWFGGSGVY